MRSSDESDEAVERGFVFGLHVAQQVFGIAPSDFDRLMDRMIDVVEEVARGELTLVRTDAEVERELETAPVALGEGLGSHLMQARREQREVAGALSRLWSIRLGGHE